MTSRADAWRAVGAAIAAPWVAFAACTSIDDLAGGGTADAGGDALAVEGGGVGDGALADGADANALDAGPDALDAGGCPATGRGPDMVRVGSFCIDRTEVTRTQYAAFLAAVGDDAAAPGPSCAWNKSLVPTATCVRGIAGEPVSGANWCQAAAFCAWAGKRLCGRIDGGAFAFVDKATASVSEWYAACSASGTRTFPYGSAFDPKACNGLGNEAGSLVPVGSKATCQGGVPGLFDMSGNVGEWLDACEVGIVSDAGPNAGDYCLQAGGDFASRDPPNGLDNLRCDQPLTSITRDSAECYWGIRCCADP
jgi:formylglycine-generating enzyme required for sulfatase activity